MTRAAQASLVVLLVANLLIACAPRSRSAQSSAKPATASVCDAPDPAALPPDPWCRSLDAGARECLHFVLDGSVLLVGEAPELPATPPRYELRYFDTGCWSVEAGEVTVTLAGDRPLDTADYAPRPSWLEVIPPNVLAAR